MKNLRKRLILFWLRFCLLFGAWKIVMPTIFQAPNKMQKLNQNKISLQARVSPDNTNNTIDNLDEYIYLKAYSETKQQSLWMVIFYMLEQYSAMSNVTLQPWTQAAVWNAVIYQRIVIEHWLLNCVLSVTNK